MISSVNSKQLMIALEPEAASVFCQSLDSENFIHKKKADETKIKAGQNIMIIDAGGKSFSKHSKHSTIIYLD